MQQNMMIKLLQATDKDYIKKAADCNYNSI